MGADSWADGDRSRRGPGLPLSGATGEAEAGWAWSGLRGAGGLAEPERVRVDMADRSRGMDDLGLLSGGAAPGSDMAKRGRTQVRRMGAADEGAGTEHMTAAGRE